MIVRKAPVDWALVAFFTTIVVYGVANLLGMIGGILFLFYLRQLIW